MECPKCSECRLFLPKGPTTGECHLNPPQPGSGLWPIVRSNDFCSRFVAKTEPKQVKQGRK